MTELAGEANVSVVMVLFAFSRAFGAVRIVIRNCCHGQAPLE
jgi:hypothetical protein